MSATPTVHYFAIDPFHDSSKESRSSADCNYHICTTNVSNRINNHKSTIESQTYFSVYPGN